VNWLVSDAWGQSANGGAGGPSLLLSLVPFLLIFAVFYFLLILPQQKRQKQLKDMLDQLKKGDKVVTASGIWGTVTNIGKHTVTLQIADNTKIKMQREHIARVRTEDDE
jgi:preprotein translocase subunit YajC